MRDDKIFLTKPKEKECGIINLADSEDSKGSHWCCYFRNKNKKIYFDSYGLTYPLEIQNYLKEPIEYNIYEIQPRNTVVCGHICLFVLYHLSKGKELYDIIFMLLP